MKYHRKLLVASFTVNAISAIALPLLIGAIISFQNMKAMDLFYDLNHRKIVTIDENALRGYSSAYVGEPWAYIIELILPRGFGVIQLVVFVVCGLNCILTGLMLIAGAPKVLETAKSPGKTSETDTG